MKKQVFALSMISALMSYGLNAQEDQIATMKNIEDGTEFVKYYDINKGTAGVPDGYTGKVSKSNDGNPKVYYLSHMNDISGEIGSFRLEDEFVEKKESKDLYRKPDHPTAPMLFAFPFDAPVFIFIEDRIYELKKTSASKVKSGDFKIEHVYITKESHEDKKNSVPFMKRLKSQKGKETNKPLSMNKVIAEIDHYSILKEYIKSMTSKQEKATLTAEQKSKFEDMEMRYQMRRDSILKKAAEDRASLRFADSGNNNNKVIVINNTGRSVCLVQGGSSRSFTSKESFNCKEPVYYGVTTDGGRNCTSQKAGVAVQSGQCGREVILR